MNLRHTEEALVRLDPYGNYYIQTEYEIHPLALDAVELSLTFFEPSGGTNKVLGFKINHKDEDFRIFHFNDYLLKNRIYFSRKLNDPRYNLVIANITYGRSYKSNSIQADLLNETYKLFTIIPLTKIVDTGSIKYLNGQSFDKDIYPELFEYLGEDTMPNIASKTFLKFSNTTNKFTVNKTKFYRVFWGHSESHYHSGVTALYNRAVGVGGFNEIYGGHGNHDELTNSVGPFYHEINWSEFRSENITLDHWDFDTGDACPQRIPLYYHMRVK